MQNAKPSGRAARYAQAEIKEGPIAAAPTAAHHRAGPPQAAFEVSRSVRVVVVVVEVSGAVVRVDVVAVVLVVVEVHLS